MASTDRGWRRWIDAEHAGSYCVTHGPPIQGLGPGRAGILEHGLRRDPEDVASLARSPRVLFFDTHGIARIAGSFSDLASVFENKSWRHWLDAFRENGRPARDLPLRKRASETEQPRER